MLHVGLDLSRRRVDVCLILSEGELVEHFRTPADRDGLYGLTRRVATAPPYGGWQPSAPRQDCPAGKRHHQSATGSAQSDAHEDPASWAVLSDTLGGDGGGGQRHGAW